jgi:hypothetical protein
LKTLQLLLQGTLLVQVNAGPAAIIKTFLANENAEKFPVEQRTQLADVVMEFVRLLSVCLKLNKSFMDPSEGTLTLCNDNNCILGSL